MRKAFYSEVLHTRAEYHARVHAVAHYCYEFVFECERLRGK